MPKSLPRSSTHFQSFSVETHRWAADHWLEPEAMIAILRAMPADGRSGDVYAARADQLTRLNEVGARSRV